MEVVVKIIVVKVVMTFQSLFTLLSLGEHTSSRPHGVTTQQTAFFIIRLSFSELRLVHTHM
jgi:hypothetical protein